MKLGIALPAAIFTGLILLGSLTIGGAAWFWRRSRAPGDFLLAGRKLPFGLAVGVIVGHCIDTSIILGGIRLAYAKELPAALELVGLGLGTIGVGMCFGDRRKSGFLSLGEEFDCYYGRNRHLSTLANVGVMAIQLLWVSVRIMAGAVVIAFLTGIPYAVAVPAIAFFGALVPVLGGLRAVAMAALLPAAILVVGFGTLRSDALLQSGYSMGLHGAVFRELCGTLFSSGLGRWALVAAVLALAIGKLADPCQRLVIYSVTSERDAKWSAVLAGSVVMLFAYTMAITGWYFAGLTSGWEAHGSLLLVFAGITLPVWLAALLAVAFVMSCCVSASLNGMVLGLYYVRHIHPAFAGHFPRIPSLAARWALVVCVGAAMVIAIGWGGVVSLVDDFALSVMSCLSVVLVIGRFWRQATWQGSLAALMVSLIMGITYMSWSDIPMMRTEAVWIATVSCLLVHVGVSLLWARPDGAIFDKAALEVERERHLLLSEKASAVGRE